MASGGASAALTATNTLGLPEDIYDVTPAELALRDRTALEEMGFDQATIDPLFLNPALSISLRHGIVKSLQRLPAGPGRAGVVKAATACERQAQAGFLNRTLQVLADRHAVKAYTSIATFGRLPAGITAEGILEVVAPVDYVSWTEGVAEFAQRDDLGTRGHRLVIDAGLSPAAKHGMEAAGWEIVPFK